MNVAIYIRCSTKQQSLDAQLADLQGYACRQGHVITHTYADFGVSGAKKNRPQLDLLMAAAQNHEFEAVLVWKLDRFGRSLSHLIESIKQLDDWKVAFLSYRDQIDMSTPVGRLMFHLICVFAEFERDVITERIKNGIQHCLNTKVTKSGVWFGHGKKHTRSGVQSPLDRALVVEMSKIYRQSTIAKKLGVSRQAINQMLKVSA